MSFFIYTEDISVKTLFASGYLCQTLAFCQSLSCAGVFFSFGGRLFFFSLLFFLALCYLKMDIPYMQHTKRH